MNKELIEKMKENERVFGVLSEEEQEVLKTAGKKNSEIFSGGIWTGYCYESCAWSLDYAYRLKESYQPEEEIVETKILWLGCPEVRAPKNNRLEMKRYIAKIVTGQILNGYQLLGYRYAEQTGDEIYNFPVGYKQDIGKPNPYGIREIIISTSGLPEDLVTANRAVWRKV